MSSQRTQHNICETNVTSVKVHYGPGGQSNWSLGWGEQTENTNNANRPNNMKYHNESNIVLGEKIPEEEREKKRVEDQKLRKQQELNNKLPTYDPKNGGKSNVFFGDEKTDYRKKDQVFTSVRVRAPPGGKSSFQLG